MFEHLVSFRLKESCEPETAESLAAELRTFKGRIPGLLEVTAGVNVTEETANRHGFALGLRATFESKEALEAYGPHPLHQQFVKRVGPWIEQVVVVDYPIL